MAEHTPPATPRPARSPSLRRTVPGYPGNAVPPPFPSENDQVHVDPNIVDQNAAPAADLADHNAPGVLVAQDVVPGDNAVMNAPPNDEVEPNASPGNVEPQSSSSGSVAGQETSHSENDAASP